MIPATWRSSAVPAFLGIALICAVAVESSRRVPIALAASAAAEVFSADRAQEHVRAIARRPHPGGSADHARVREYLLTALRQFGLSPTVQETTGVGTHNSVVGHVINIVARVPGERTGAPAVLLVAHYDGVPAGAAAADDGAGVAVVLEVVRALRAGPPVAHDVIVLFTDGEEAGLTGAAAFVREHPWARDVAAVLNLDSGGTRGQSVAYQISAANTDVVTALRKVGVIGNSLASALLAVVPYDTDLSELARLGKPAVGIGLLDGSQRYHTPDDDVAHLAAASLQQQGVQVLGLLRALANGPLPRPRATNSVFFTMPALGMIQYPASWALSLAIVAGAIVVIGMLQFTGGAGGSWREVSLGFVGVTTALIVATAIAAGVGAALERMLEPSPVLGWSEVRGLSALGIAVLSIGVASAVWVACRRRASSRGIHLGALALWVVLALAAAWALVGASFVFVLPLLAVAVVGSWTDRKAGVAASVARWSAILVSLLIIVPVAFSLGVVEAGMGMAGAAVIGLLVSLSFWLLAPQLETRAGRSPIVMSALALVVLGGSVLLGRRNASFPIPSMLAYAFDADTQAAWLLAPARLARAGSWGAASLGKSARLINPSSADPTWLTRAIAGESATLATSTTRVDVGVPEIVVVSDSIRDGGRRLTLRVRPAPATYSVRLRTARARIDSAFVDGRAIEMASANRSSVWSLGYVAPPDAGFEMSLAIHGQEPLELDVVARSLGLPAVVQATLPPRPNRVVPVHSGDQTVVHRLFRL